MPLAVRSELRSPWSLSLNGDVWKLIFSYGGPLACMKDVCSRTDVRHEPATHPERRARAVSSSRGSAWPCGSDPGAHRQAWVTGVLLPVARSWFKHKEDDVPEWIIAVEHQNYTFIYLPHARHLFHIRKSCRNRTMI